MGARVTLTATALLDIEGGTFNAGDTGDPFTDTSSAAHLPIINNATFNITAGNKHVASIVGVGATTVSFGAMLDVGSSGPVTQSTFTVNGSADVGNVNVSGTTSTGASGYLTSNYVRGGTLSLGASSLVKIKPNGGVTGVSAVTSLTIGASARLNIDDNDMVINYAGPSPAATIRAYLVAGRGPSGFGNATWNGTSGIISSAASTPAQGLGGTGDGVNLAIGYAENSAMPLGSYTSFSGQTVGSSSILIKFTRGADADLDGIVGNSDVTIVGGKFGAAGSGEWYFGDFDYSGSCDNADVTALGGLFNPAALPLSAEQLSAQFGDSFAAAFASGQSGGFVPEPASLALAGLCALTWTRRRRRQKICEKAI